MQNMIEVVVLIAAFLGGLVLLAIIVVVLNMISTACKEVLTRHRRFINCFVTQEMVTARLRVLAEGLKKLFDQQVFNQNNITPDTSYESREKAHETIGKSIAKSKKEFWDEVELARRFGFAVPNTIEDALAGRVKMFDKDNNTNAQLSSVIR